MASVANDKHPLLLVEASGNLLTNYKDQLAHRVDKEMVNTNFGKPTTTQACQLPPSYMASSNGLQPEYNKVSLGPRTIG
jgi:hypothetical protein